MSNLINELHHEIHKLKCELAEARKPRKIALIGGVGSVLANALQNASRTAPEPEMKAQNEQIAAEYGIDLSTLKPCPVAPELVEQPCGFYEEIERRLNADRIARVTTDRPANLHDYQGCVDQPEAA